MITEDDIKRINELYYKSQNEGLTDAEKEEQQNLRKAYIEAMRGNIKSQLDSIVVQRPDGTREKLKRKKKK